LLFFFRRVAYWVNLGHHSLLMPVFYSRQINHQKDAIMTAPDVSNLTIIPASNDDLTSSEHRTLGFARQVANAHVAQGVFVDYLSRKSDNTIRRQAASLARFADYLDRIGESIRRSFGTDMAAFAEAVYAFPDGTVPNPDAWQAISWGLVEGFRHWMVQQGEAVSTINTRLSAVKAYAKLAIKAGVLTPEAYAVIRTVVGYSRRKQACQQAA
jgi:hypothetical protein